MKYRLQITNTLGYVDQLEVGYAHINQGVLEYFEPDSEIKVYMPVCNLSMVRVIPLPEEESKCQIKRS